MPLPRKVRLKAIVRCKISPRHNTLSLGPLPSLNHTTNKAARAFYTSGLSKTIANDTPRIETFKIRPGTRPAKNRGRTLTFLGWLAGRARRNWKEKKPSPISETLCFVPSHPSHRPS